MTTKVTVYKTFKTREEAEQFARSYYLRYPPFPYDTDLSVAQSEVDSDWYVSGSRYGAD